jgi:hypothetical protein
MVVGSGNIMSHRSGHIALGLALVLSAGSAALATPIAPGGLVNLFGTNLGADPSLAGTVIDSVTTPFIGLDAGSNVRFTGVLHANVVRETTNTLTFYYQLHNDATSLDPITRFANTSFSTWLTNVEFRNDAQAGIAGGSAFVGNQPPTEATRSVAPGSVVGFDFLAPGIGGFGLLNPGADSMWAYIRTNATAYTAGNTSIINGGNANVTTFAPIPEPAAFALLLLGATTISRRRR